MSLLFPTIAAFIGTVCLILAINSMVSERHSKDGYHRLRRLFSKSSEKIDESIVIGEQKFTRDWLNQIERWLTKLVTLDHIVEQAGLRLSTTAFFVMCALSGLLGAWLALILAAPALLTPLVAAVFLFLPYVWLRHRRARRLRAFAVQLPDALEMISRSLRAGHSVPSAMQLVARETLPPLSHEFERCCHRQSLGVPLTEGLRDMLRRVPNDDVRFFYTAIRMQQKFGGNLTEILDTIAAIIRERFQIMGQVRALTGEGRMSGLVLLLLPICLGLGLYYMQPDYLRPLVADPVGRKLLGIAIVLQIAGALAIRKIVNIKI